MTTTNLATQFVSVYLSPQNIHHESYREVGHIVQKQTSKEDKSNLSNGHAGLENVEKEARVVANFFRLSKHMLHCHVTVNISSDNLNDFISVLLSFNNTGKTTEKCAAIVLSSDRLVSYQGYEEERDIEGPVQRCLISPSSPWCFEAPCILLEQPNVIKGVAAAVLTGCAFAGIPCLLLINFADSENSDSITLSGFSSTFRVALIEQLLPTVSCTISAERLKKLNSKPVISDGIFM